MVTKSKLKMALAAEKGTDFKKIKEKRQQKAANKRKQTEQEHEVAENSQGDEAAVEIEIDEEIDSEDDEDNDEEENGVDLDAIDDSESSDSSIDMEERKPRKHKTQTAGIPSADDDDDEEEEEDDEDIPLSDLEDDLNDDDREDLIPHAKLTANNTTALKTCLKRIATIPTSPSDPFAPHQSVVSATLTENSIPDAQDDLARELAFYTQARDAVEYARKRLRAEKVPFSRPKDYFAEMVKEDAHMDKIKAKLVQEASNKKAAAEARKQRDLKKFGKQVQVAKLQERQKQKRETLEKIKTLKRKRSETGNEDTKEADIFDVGIEKELKNYKSNSDRSGPGRGNNAAGSRTNTKRQKKNEKYGFGGKKRHAKSGDAVSSSDLSGFNAKKMKASGNRVSKTARPGKARRKAMAGK